MTEKLEALKRDGWMDFSFNKSPKCPHCGDYFNIENNDAYYLYDDSNDHTIECTGCELPYEVRVHASYSFSTDEQDDE